MIIDILLLCLVVLGAIRGFFRGLILALFALVAYVLGLAAAMKFSHAAAEWLAPMLHAGSRWMPLIGFLVVFVGVVLLVRWLALLLQKAMEGLMLGWANRLGGMVFYIVLYVTIYSVLLFYLVKMRLIGPDTLRHSVTYPYLSPIAPKIIGALGLILPWFRDIFDRLDKFFDKVGP
jgi:membrane protein required for colicin V production